MAAPFFFCNREIAEASSCLEVFMDKIASGPLTHVVERALAKHLVSYISNQEVMLATLFEIKQKLPQTGWKYLLYHALEDLALYPKYDSKNTRLTFALNHDKIAELDIEGMFPWEEIRQACFDKPRAGTERLIIVCDQMARKLY